MTEVKQTLRQQMRLRRDAVPMSVRKLAASDIANNFMGSIPFSQRDIIAFYWPVGSEIDLSLMADALIEQGHICVLPVIEEKDNPLIFRQYMKNMELFIHPKYLIKEPPKSARIFEPTIIIIPLLAFDALGHRLGYGGGFYDRTLDKLQKKANILTVGVAYDFMQVAQLPIEKHDQKLDCVITDKRVIVFD